MRADAHKPRTVEIVADTRPLDAAIAELAATCAFKDLRERLIALFPGFGVDWHAEIATTCLPAARVAGKHFREVLRIGVRPGSRLEACIAAARTLRLELGRHRGLPPRGLKARTSKSTRRERLA